MRKWQFRVASVSASTKDDAATLARVAWVPEQFEDFLAAVQALIEQTDHG